MLLAAAPLLLPCMEGNGATAVPWQSPPWAPPMQSCGTLRAQPCFVLRLRPCPCRNSCEFRNVCLNTASWEIEYFLDPAFAREQLIPENSCNS